MSDNCDKEIYDKGTTVWVTHTIAARFIEEWVQKVAKLSGQRVDWFYMAGRAVVRALGNLDAVDRAIKELLPEHDALFEAACREYDATRMRPPRWDRRAL